MNVARQMIENRLTAVIRTRNQGQALQAARAAVEGGIRTVEITLTVPDAGEVVRRLRREHRREREIVVGAGTILSADDARGMIRAGAQFIVSPITQAKVAAVTRRAKVVYVGGAFTPTEIFAARDLRVDFIKIFPYYVVGDRYIRSLLQLDPTLRFMPSGGIDRAEIKGLFEVGARVVCLGNELFSGFFTGEDSYEGLVRRVRAHVELAAPRPARRSQRKPGA